MPMPWFLLSLALGRSPGVLSLERLIGLQDTARCSPGLSCHLWDGDVLCLPGSVVSAPGPVLVPARLQTELVLRCRQETDCDLCVRVAVHLAVRGPREEREEEEEQFGAAASPELEDSRNAALQARVVLSFQAYHTTRCVLLEVQVPAALARPGPSAGSVVFDCFEAALGAEVRLWSYTQPRYQKELNVTQLLPDCKGLEVQDSIQSCWALPWLSVSAEGDLVRLVLDVPKEQRFGLALYRSQAHGAPRPWWHRNLTGPQTITLNHTDLLPCLCIQVWPLEPDSVRTSTCPFREDPRALRNLWRAARPRLLPPHSWRLDAPCSLPAEATLCWQAPGGGPCRPLAPPLPRDNVTVNKAHEFPLLRGHPNLCIQLWDDDRGALWACPMDKYIHRRWALVWLGCLLVAAALLLLLLLLLRKDPVKGWLRLLKQDYRFGAAAGGRAALLLYSADDAGFERLVGALASALCALPLRVAVELWSRRELSAQGPLAWFHAQRRRTLQEGGVVVLLFSPGAVALCREWLQDGVTAPAARGPHDAFAASLSCVLPDFQQGRAPGRYVGACFEGLLPPDAVPALFRTVPVFSLPSQLPDFLGALQGPCARGSGRLAERAQQVSRTLQPALDSCFQHPGAPGRGARWALGPGTGLE
ncbi:interleukin-17 receptor C isoform X6 [Oryctolagus cuniculus]|uniref:interleukin-17 receptor C isoform X6 n=1 Tax=Oryctolagus cuniculus TaxID=9986 RepID=UPI00387A29C3